MPTIRVKSNDWGDLTMAVARLCIDPKSQRVTAALENELIGNVCGETVHYLGFENIQLTEQELELSRRAGYRRLQTIEDNRTNIRDADIAGHILWRAVRLAHYAPEQASIGKAQKIVERQLKAGPQKLGLKSLKAIWARYKAISHFTAAPLLAPHVVRDAAQMMLNVQKMERSGELGPIRTKLSPAAGRDLMRGVEEAEEIFGLAVAGVYAIADKLRAYCATRYAPGQKVRKRPFDHAQAMWKIPPQFDLPDVELTFGPPLSEVELSVLHKRQ